MAIYHFSAQVICRGSGGSSTESAAYRSGEKITDLKTGLIYDYTRKEGVEYSEIILPTSQSENRADFWNRVEAHHKRKDAVVAREINVALPHELTAQARQALAVRYARGLSEQYQVGVDLAIHAPSRHGDERNHHMHIMLSGCTVGDDGTLGKKCVELDPIYCSRNGLDNMVEVQREAWQNLANEALKKSGHDIQITHESYEKQGLDIEPTIHLGKSATALERQGVKTQLGDYNRAVFEGRNANQNDADQLDLEIWSTANYIKELQDEKQTQQSDMDFLNAIGDSFGKQIDDEISQEKEAIRQAAEAEKQRFIRNMKAIERIQRQFGGDLSSSKNNDRGFKR